MEFDELKNIWKKESFLSMKEEDIAVMVKGRSKSIVSKLKRRAWFELMLTLSAGFFLLYYSFTSPVGALKWTYISLVILFAAFIVYYVKKISLLNRFTICQDNIRANIQRLVSDLNVYLKFYRRGSVILYPFYFFLMLFFIVIDLGMENFLYSLSQPAILISLGLVVLFISACSLWITSWYVDKLYGNYVKKLEELLNDLGD